MTRSFDLSHSSLEGWLFVQVLSISQAVDSICNGSIGEAARRDVVIQIFGQ
jgi:hypothetical protein